MSEGENTPASVPSTPKTDNKPVVEEPQKKLVNNVEKAVDNAEEDNKVVQTQEKTAVFDELGGKSRLFFFLLKFLREITFFPDYIV